MKNIRICVLGVPGSGKTTICSLLAEVLPNTRLYDVGSILREQAPTDEHIKNIHASGGLVESNKVLSIFDDALQQESFILSGSPRKDFEAEYVLSHDQWQSNPGYLIHLDLDQKVAEKRLVSRGRFDDKHDVIQNRFDNYFNNTINSIERFKKAGRLITINAAHTPEVVSQTTLMALGMMNK